MLWFAKTQIRAEIPQRGFHRIDSGSHADSRCSGRCHVDPRARLTCGRSNEREVISEEALTCKFCLGIRQRFR